MDRFDDSLDVSVAGSHADRCPGNSPHWMDRVGAGISSSLAQMRILFNPNSHQSAGLPPPPPYTETSTLSDNPPAYQRGATTNGNVPSVYLVVIPAGKPPPSYNESMSLPDLVQSTGNANRRDDLSPSTSNHFVPVMTENSSAGGAYSTTDSVVESSSATNCLPDDSQLPQHFLPQRRCPGGFPSIPFAIYRSSAGLSDDAIESSRPPIDADAAGTADAASALAAAATTSPFYSNEAPDSGVTLLQNPLSHFLHNDGGSEEGIHGLRNGNGVVDQSRPSSSSSSSSFGEEPPAYDDIFTGSVVSYDSSTNYPAEEEEEEEEDEEEQQQQLDYPSLQSPRSQPLPSPSEL